MSTRVNRRGVVRRDALIDAAIELWATSGWRRTGITAVAERAGITPSGLLHHFGTKENFLLEVIAQLDHTLQAENLDPDSPAHASYVARHAYLRGRWAGAIRAGQTSGEIRPDADPDLIAVQILAFLHGMLLHDIHGPYDVDPTTPPSTSPTA